MTQDMNHTFVKALRAVLVAAMMSLTGSHALAQGDSQSSTSTGVVVNGNVFGGGNLAEVKGSVTVNMTAGTVDKDVYGGGALANTNTNIANDATIKTTVNLLGGTIKGDAYGGGLGRLAKAGTAAVYIAVENGTQLTAGKKYYTSDAGEGEFTSDGTEVADGTNYYELTTPAVVGIEAVEAKVYGDINVKLGKEDGSSATAFDINYYTGDHSDVVKSGRVFGCNNLNGSPQGNVTVTVWKTVAGNTNRSETANKDNANATYEVAAVYGGGNLANYTTAGKKTHVIINGCNDTSIKYVYGGGNAAAVPETDVDINAAYELGYVFGGGNGKDQYTLDGTNWINNPGANVSGNANTVLTGGVIHEAFGGSNEKGTISGSVSIDTQSGGSTCALSLGKLYGAGKNADIEGDLIVILGCMPGDENKTTEVYGGAENANVKGNVELTITSGSFGKVFGGNNTSGAIFGHIKLNIEETGCTPIKIDELYLGGFNAPYSVYGYYQDGTIEGTDKPLYKPIESASDHSDDVVSFTGKPHTVPPYAAPELNIISCTQIGKVFGGGLGTDAVIYGNPTVNINMIKGTATGSLSTIGTIGDVFGGGNAAAVVGNTTVNIGTETTMYVVVPNENITVGTTEVNSYFIYNQASYATANGTAVAGTTYYEKTTVNGNDVYTPIDVENDASVSSYYTFNEASYSSATGTAVAGTTYYEKKSVLGANISSNIYGGGNLADVTGNTNVNICAKKGTGDAYTSVAFTTAQVTISGNVFGGGKGSGEGSFTCSKAMVGVDGEGLTDNTGGTIVRIGNGTVNHNVYGGGEVGRVEKNTVVMIGVGDADTSNPKINGNVFGAGEGLETHGYSALVRGNSTVTVQAKAEIGGSVYGGGQIATVGRYIVVNGYPTESNGGGLCSVTIKDNAKVSGNVVGCGKGVVPYENTTSPERMAPNNELVSFGSDQAAYLTFLETLALASETQVIIGGNTTGKKAVVEGNVYGGSESGFLQRHAQVTILDNCEIGTTSANGNIYGGGKGLATFAEAGRVSGYTNVAISGGTTHGSVYGGGELGYTKGGTTVSVTGGNVSNDVYGGGALANTNIGNGTEYVAVPEIPSNPKTAGLSEIKYKTTGDGTVVDGKIYYEKNSANVYVVKTGLTVGESIPSGLYEIEYKATTDQKAALGKTYYELKSGVYVVKSGLTAGETSVSGLYEITYQSTQDETALVGKSYYIQTHNTVVNLTGGTVGGDVYGGGLGQQEVKSGETVTTEGIPAYVYGEVTVNLNDNSGTCQVDGSVFGCNNENGSPKGNVTVNVYGTSVHNTDGSTKAKPDKLDAVTTEKDFISPTDAAVAAHTFELAGVYGGGNLATYSPVDDKSTTVNVYGCTTSCIKEVYGGGNSADVTNCAVNVFGAYEIGYVYNGGNGWLKDVDGATSDAPANVTGDATTTIRGGTIYRTFGGSNTNGSIGGTATLDIADGTGTGACDLYLGDVFGYGNRATMSNPANVTLGCLNHKVGALYGGAMNADINSDVTLTINSGTFANVFGGNKSSGTISGSIKVIIEQTDPTCPVNIDNLYGCGNDAAYTTPDGEDQPEVRIISCTSIGNVFGGGYGSNATVTGNPTVNINMVKSTDQENLGTVGNVYGGGYGANVTGNTIVNIGTAATITMTSERDSEGNLLATQSTKNVEGANITGSVYGGGYAANVDGNTEVNIGTVDLAQGATGITIGTDVYGGGEGSTTNVTGSVEVNVGNQITSGNTTSFVGGATISNDVYGGSAFGKVNYKETVDGTTQVNLYKGTINGIVFGGGKGVASTPTVPATETTPEVPADPGVVAEVYGATTVTLYGDVVAGGIYGGCNLNGTMKSSTQLDLLGGRVGVAPASGASTPDIVFGGGLGKDTKVDGNVTVNVGDADNAGTTIYSNVYGGSAKGTVNSSTSNTTTVNLFKGIIYGDVFGGGLGDAQNPAAVKGKVVVKLNENNGTCFVSGSIFGCNNTNGSPEGDVEVHIYNTVHLDDTGKVETSDPDTGAYEMTAVYGGGKKAAFTASGKTAKVYIETCDPSIQDVYGGGFGADVPNTYVEVKGAKEIRYVFGGGYGADTEGFTNPGANVNGTTNVLLEGGTVHEAYGGSNTKGDITGGSNVNVSDNGNTSCPLSVEHVYGGGKNARMSGGANITLGCQPNTWIEDIYAGSREADVDGNVGLTITSGKFKRVFGGNKTSGKLKGSITVNIEETGNCDTPIIIGELYAGGNEADYSIYGYYQDGVDEEGKPKWKGRTRAQYDTWFNSLSDEDKAKPENQIKADPQLNVRAFTSIGAIYGGGYSAKMYGNPTVSINVVKGYHSDDALEAGSTPALAGTSTTLPYPAHASGAIGTIGNVFGGGNLATVYGSTTVNIGTESTVTFITEPAHLGTKGTDYTYDSTTQLYSATVEGANITGNVYGGGKLADVTGNTQINICAKEEDDPATTNVIEYSSVPLGTAGVTIGIAGDPDADHGNVFGGGKGEATTFTCEKAMVGIDGAGADAEHYPNYSDGNTIIIIGNGTVNGSVYGGGEIGRVEMNTSVTIGLGDGVDATTNTPTSAPEITGSVYGGGKGVKTHGYSALVRGNPTVTVQGNAKVRGNVYGGGQIASVARYNVAKTDDEGAPYGVKHDMPYALKTNSSGFCTVNVQGYAEIGPATIGEETETLVGHVFGAGKGIVPGPGGDYAFVQGTTQRMVSEKNDQGEVTNNSKWETFATEADYITFVKTLALSSQTNVTIDGNAKVKGSVFGGSESGFVQFDTNVTVKNGTIGTQDKGGADFGNVYGGGKGDAVHTGNSNNYFAAGLVKGDTKVKVEGGSILHNIYGGGAYGTVGEFAYGNDGMPTGRRKYTVNSTETETTGGNTEVYITGGTIGTNGDENGMIFGSSRGDVGAPGAIHDKLAWVYDTHVAIGDTIATTTTAATPLIKGSIYGGGENGHNLHSSFIRINGGTIGITEGEEITYTENGQSVTKGGAAYPYRGNVYGGGCGTDKYDNDTKYNPLAGIVRGDATIRMTAGQVVHNMYGAGAMGSVGNFEKNTSTNAITFNSGGTTTIAISGGTVGVDGSDNGNVFGAARGNKAVTDRDLALVKETSVTISGTTTGTQIKGNVYGGGEVGNVHANTRVDIQGGVIARNVFGGGKGVEDLFTCEQAMVGVEGEGAGQELDSDENKNKGTSVTVSNGTVGTLSGGNLVEGTGNVYGGGEIGRVEWNTQVKIGVGTGNGSFAPTIYGNVFGAGKGLKTHGYSALVRGNSAVTIQGGARIGENVYGGGEMSTVGRYWVKNINNIDSNGDPLPNAPTPPDDLPDGMPYQKQSGGICRVTIQGSAVIGTNGTDDKGHVFGAGKGVDSRFVASGQGASQKMIGTNQLVPFTATADKTAEQLYYEFLQTLALVTETYVTIDGSAHVNGSAFGGSESGFVQTNTDVKIQGSGCVIGTTTYGNIFGGGKGLEYFAEAGKVKGNTTIAVSAGTIKGNIYGGGRLGDVGIIDKTDTKDGQLTYNYKWKQSDGLTANVAEYNVPSTSTHDTSKNTGICKVTVSGGTIGLSSTSEPTKHGNVFGAGRGSSTTWWCEKAIAYATDVSVTKGTVYGNVYGGGEVGRVEDDTKVTIGAPNGTDDLTITGSVFGAGAGLATHGYSALVRGNAGVTVQGKAKVEGSVYGGGEIASVGRFHVVGGLPRNPQAGGTCTVKIQGNAKIGSSGTGHNVFGACKGVTPAYNNEQNNPNRSKSMQLRTNKDKYSSWSNYNDDSSSPFIWVYYETEDDYLDFLETLALTSNTHVTVDGSSNVYGSVFGGGERGVTLGGVEVNMTGGTVHEDVYGGGSLADSNRAMWDAANNRLFEYVPLELIPGLSHVTGYYKGDDHVLVTAENEIADEGEANSYSAIYKTNVNLTGGVIKHDAYGGGLGRKASTGVTAVEAMVYGDVKVELNNNNNGGTADGSKSGCAVNRVFGCNNLNGTPKGKVQVYVYATQKKGETKLSTKAAKNTNTYDVQAVYGGGNLAAYEPVDALLDYSDEDNKEKVDAARPEVYIDGCDLTSIKQVYGGGNAAPAPATYVEINRAYEIDEAFGGGNGYDDYSLQEGNNTVWYQNPGANVGYYTYADYPKTGTDAGAGTLESPWKAVEIEKFSGGAVNKPNRLSTTDEDAIKLRYGSGIATLVVKGGTVHTSYGGSNSKGNVRAKLASTYSAMFDDCPMAVGTSYGGGKNAYSDADAEVEADCAKGVKEMFGGAENADFDGDVNMLITNGSSLERVFGGNNTSGAFNGNITITIKEGGCEPIRIGSLYAGGYLAPYSVYGYKKDANGNYETVPAKDPDGNVILDEDNNPILEPIPLTAAVEGYERKNDPRINVISATSIDNIFGGGYQAKLVGNPHINVNMEPGRILAKFHPTEGDHQDDSGKTYVVKSIEEGTGDGILALGSIGNIYGGGNMADIVGNTYVEIGTGKWITSWDNEGKAVYENISPARNAATITESVYGGGNQADVTGNTYVTMANGTVESKVFGGGNLGAVGTYTTEDDGTPKTWTTGTGFCNVTITGGTVGIENPTLEKPGHVFGGGQGQAIKPVADEAVPGAFKCAKGMVYETNVSISNGTVKGSVYGGGEVGRVENDTRVTIGLEGDENSAPVIEGEVFGAGKGVHSHGYAALVRGNTYVTVQGNAKVKECVYGGGEIASVGRYNIADAAYHASHPKIDVGMPYSLANSGSGYCNVIVRDNAEVGPDNMQMTKDDGPDDTGYVFGAGKGILPYEGTNTTDNKPGRVKPDNTWQDYSGTTAADTIAYLRFIETQGLATQTDVTITGNAFIKGSVYGGSFNGHVQHNTHVTIDGDCQIGQGEGITKRYTEHYGAWPTDASGITTSWKECSHWDYDPNSGAPYDMYATKLIEGKYYYDKKDAQGNYIYAEGGAPKAKDGHTYYGNVFGGGSGYIPYAPGKWHREAGSVGGNTQVDITGGHILTSVYGGNEQTDVGTYKDMNNTIYESGGKCTINMTGGTIGVPRTVEDMMAHPVTCYLFGAGKGDQRIFFNTWTNVMETEVNISGDARIYGSAFGGGEDGHVIGDAKMNISGNVIIGTTGTSYVDGNVFGGGRGFSGDAQTAGTVGGDVEVNIEDGTILGSVYGGGRLASVGTLFTAPNDPNYGQFLEDAATYYSQDEADAYNSENGLQFGDEGYVTTETIKYPAGSRGHVTVNISGGTIGRDFVKDEAGNLPAGAEHSGNVFGGSMGRLTFLDNTTINPIWPKMAQVKTSTVYISGDNTRIKRNVYGGGELGTVREDATVTIGRTKDADANGNPSNPTISGNVFGGGYGSEDYNNPTTVKVYWNNAPAYYTYTPMQWAGCVGGNTTVSVAGGQVKQNVYGGGQMASVGIIDYSVKADDSGPFEYEGATYAYNSITKHADIDNPGTSSEKVYGFGLSWPYEFTYVPCNPAGFIGGKTTVTVEGGRIEGYVYGAGKGKAFERYTEAFFANVRETKVNINYPNPAPSSTGGSTNCIVESVYGGGEDGHVYENSAVDITGGLIGVSVYGGGKGEGKYPGKLYHIVEDAQGNKTAGEEYDTDLPSWTAGKVYGNSSVTMSGGHVLVNVYGGGNMGSVGKGNYASGTDDYYPAGYGETLTDAELWKKTDGFDPDAPITESNKPTTMADYFLSSGKCTVNIIGGTIGTSNTVYGTVGLMEQKTPTGMVFGGSRGKAAEDIGRLSPRYAFAPDFFLGYVNKTEVTIGVKDDDTHSPTIYSQVFGGGRDGHVRNSSHVIINNGTIGQAYDAYNSISDEAERESQRRNCGNVYASGSGMGTWDGKHHGTSSGSITRNATVEVNGGTIYGNVYGGGAMSSVGPPRIPPTAAVAGIDWSKCTVNINGGYIGIGSDYSTYGYGGCVFGASRGGDLTADEFSEGNLDNYATTLWNEVNIKGGNIAGDVYGGGQAGRVKKDNTVNLTGGTVAHDVFGGGMGTSTIAANVGGNTTVTLNGTPTVQTVGESSVTSYLDDCVVNGSIFGANNVKGTPKGHVTVHVFKTANSAKDPNVLAANRTTYDVAAVYGGGKQADYVPDAADAQQSTEVIIEGCDLTSIKDVYGGGYGAATPGTNVLIKGTYIIDNVFGGGYGASTPEFTNPGANVGYLSDGETQLGPNDGGKAVVQLMAGTVNHVYGGSNTLGNIRGGSNVGSVTNDNGPGCCEQLTVQEIYGGGKNADMYGGAEIVLGCMPNDWIGAIYAGAESSDVGNDVSLTLTSGKFGRVFGGNKSGGRLNGGIEVNIEENGTCGTPIIIGELYGGGNEAPYSIYGYKKDEKDNWIPRQKSDYDALSEAQKLEEGIHSGPNHDPVVNVRAFTSIGNIYGGGYGATAVVVGNPIVNINEVKISHTDTDAAFDGNEYAGETITIGEGEDAIEVELHPHTDGEIGVIGNVFGGGNAAKVIGNTNVNIGTTAEEGFESLRAADGTLPTKPVVGADIRGNVYGGGNAAEVTGDTNVVIGKKASE